MTQLASWYRRTELHAQADRQVARAVLESQTFVDRHPNTYLPADAWLLRGIPVVGVHGGVGGASPGTKPHSREW